MSTAFEGLLDTDARALVEFERMRFEIAWRHFDLHARQRTTMFHFFMLLVPFLFGGCFFLFKEREVVGSFPAIVAAGAGALLALIFSGLDLRNKQLYRVSKEALGLIEEQFLSRHADLSKHLVRITLASSRPKACAMETTIFSNTVC
jgi:hypothetical protein